MNFRDFNDRPARNFPPREMVKGNWTCSGCGKEITELPFEPSADRPIFCKDCWKANREKTRGNFQPRERKMVQGSWTCATCGKEITELPFEPSEGKPIHCRDCWRENRSKNF